MTVFDYVVIVLMTASVVLGAWRGVFGEILALLAWILAFFAARWWGAEFARVFFSSLIADASWRLLAGFVAVFILVLVLMSLLRLATKAMLRAVGLGLSDKFFGLLFGFARGFIVILVVMAIFGMTAIPKERWWKEAYFSPALENAVLFCTPWLPSEIAKRIHFR